MYAPYTPSHIHPTPHLSERLPPGKCILNPTSQTLNSQPSTRQARSADHLLRPHVERVLPTVLSMTSPIFDLKSCNYRLTRGKEGCSRVVTWRLLTRSAFTIEASFRGPDYGPLRDLHLTIPHLQVVSLPLPSLPPSLSSLSPSLFAPAPPLFTPTDPTCATGRTLGVIYAWPWLRYFRQRLRPVARASWRVGEEAEATTCPC
jgi:hypothetical protein